ncbi:MAG: hypothetical protein COB14_04910 [Alphaproteobacteria bacterium]|nr:MAG: hypothetical protein COB14_04910 [Alphaproteobacteria bacterium]
MGMQKLIEKLLPLEDLYATVRRFPRSTLCSVILFAFILLLNHKIIEPDKVLLLRVMVILAYGFLWFGLARLISEGMSRGRVAEAVLGYCVFAIFSGCVFFYSGFTLVWLLGLITCALLLGISIGPYIKSGDNLSLWFYNRCVWQGISISIIAGLIWGGGISAAMLSIHYLFGLYWGSAVYFDVTAFSMVVFAPIYALSWIPEKYIYTEDDCHAPPQLSFVLNWVLAPLVIIYMLILYAYFIKIALVGEIPRGHLSYMISAFGGVGVLTYLMGWPLRETGGVFLRAVYKLFFPALFIPALMQAWSIWMRIEQYGLTEQRYVLVLMTFWLIILAVAYTIRKPALKFIPGFLSLLLVIAAVGPFSAPNMSVKSQANRLENLLTHNKILVDGRIVTTQSQVSFGDRKSISSILNFLNRRDRKDVLDSWLVGADIKKDGSFPKLTMKLMGLDHMRYSQRKRNRSSENFNINSDDKKSPVNVDGFKLLTPSQYVLVRKRLRPGKTEKRQWRLKNTDETGIVAYYKNDMLSIGIDDREEVSFSVEEYALAQFKKDPSSNHRDLIMEGAQGDLRVKIIFRNLTLRREKDEDQKWGEYKLKSFRFRALIGY